MMASEDERSGIKFYKRYLFSRSTMDDMKKVDNSSCNDGVLLRMGLNDNKAGMQGLDREIVSKIITEATKVDKLVIEMEQSHNLSSIIVHVDMDAFYAAVEMRDNPELKEKPIAVREMLAEYDPNFMPMGLDEAYLNITEHLEERLNCPEDKRRFFFNTESTTEKGKDDINMSAKFNEDGYSSSWVLFEDNTPLMDDHHEQRSISGKFGCLWNFCRGSCEGNSL